MDVRCLARTRFTCCISCLAMLGRDRHRLPRVVARAAGGGYHKVTATPAGIAVTFAEPSALAAIDVHDAQNNLLARLPLAGTRTRFEAPFAWPAAGRYLIELRWPSGRYQTELDVPTWPAMRATLEAGGAKLPSSSERQRRTELLVPQSGATSRWAFLSRACGKSASHYEVRLQLGAKRCVRHLAMGAGN